MSSAREGDAPAREANKAARDAAGAAPAPLDLRSLPRRQQRELDLENPFRR